MGNLLHPCFICGTGKNYLSPKNNICITCEMIKEDIEECDRLLTLDNLTPQQKRELDYLYKKYYNAMNLTKNI